MVGDEIRALRKQKKLTQKELAGKTGLAEITIRRYEDGKRSPKLESALKIADALEADFNIVEGFVKIKNKDKRVIEVGKNIKAIREYRGYTQSYVGEQLGFSQNAVHNWESGIREPRLTNLYALADLLEVDIMDFFWEREGK